MSNQCPLCDNIKDNNDVFCSDCKNKIEREYEVNVGNKINNKDNISTTPIDSIEMEKQIDINQNQENNKKESNISTNKSRNIKMVLSMILAFIVIGASLFIYKDVIRKDNQEKSSWNQTMADNTIASYIDYMVSFPKGKNYNLAEEAIMRLKQGDSEHWERLRLSDNSAELKDFISSNPQSSYTPLIRRRLDSISWQSSLKDNTNESYKRYIDQSVNGDYEGYYLAQANDRLELLTQKSPTVQDEEDKIKEVVDGFFVGLSAVDATNIEKYLAPRVFQFFNNGGNTREKIIGDLIISGSKTQAPTIKFTPNISNITYQKSTIEHYDINVPLQKTITSSSGSVNDVYGFIVQMELNNEFQIIAISEISAQ